MIQVGAVNYLAVAVAAVAAMAAGMAWYSDALFRKRWAKLLGKTGKDMANMQKNMAGLAAKGFVVLFTGAFVLAHFVSGLALFDALLVGFLLWLGFMMTTAANRVIWQGDKLELFLIDTGNHLLNLMAMSAVLSLMG
jgi:hypothetical protein